VKKKNTDKEKLPFFLLDSNPYGAAWVLSGLEITHNIKVIHSILKDESIFPPIQKIKGLRNWLIHHYYALLKDAETHQLHSTGVIFHEEYKSLIGLVDTEIKRIEETVDLDTEHTIPKFIYRNLDFSLLLRGRKSLDRLMADKIADSLNLDSFDYDYNHILYILRASDWGSDRIKEDFLEIYKGAPNPYVWYVIQNENMKLSKFLELAINKKTRALAKKLYL
jgi:hypothetical protein